MEGLLKKRGMVIGEIKSTEKTYHDQIAAFVEHFATPLKHGTHASKIGREFLSHARLASLCQNMATIEQVSKQLSSRFTNNGSTLEGMLIGNVFHEFSALLLLYGQYAENHAASADDISKFAARDDFKSLWHASFPNGNTPDISSYLILPIQRVPRYCLLLREAIKCTQKILAAVRENEEDEEAAIWEKELQLLTSSMEKVEIAATNMNEVIRHNEMRNQLRALQSKFIGGSLDLVGGLEKGAARFLLMKGKLVKVSRRRHKPFFFHLLSDTLLYSKKLPTGFQLHRALSLAGGSIEDVPAPTDSSAYRNYVDAKELENGNGGCAFRITTTKKSFIVYSSSHKEKMAWVTAFSRALAQSEKGDESAKAPVWETDASSDACQRCGTQFTVLKRRHHCRRCGVLACGSCCSRFRYLTNLEKVKRVCDHCCTDMDRMAHSERASDFRLNARTVLTGSPKGTYFKLCLKRSGGVIAARGPSDAQGEDGAFFTVPVPLPLTSEYELDLEMYDSQSNEMTGSCNIDMQEVLLMHRIMKGEVCVREYAIIPAVRKLGSAASLKTKFSPTPSPVHRAMKTARSFSSFMDVRKGRNSSVAASSISIEWELKCPPSLYRLDATGSSQSATQVAPLSQAVHLYEPNRIINASIIKQYEAECANCPTKWQANAVTILYTESIRALRSARDELKARSAGWDAGNLWCDIGDEAAANAAQQTTGTFGVENPTAAKRLMNRLQDKIIFFQSRVQAFHKDQAAGVERDAPTSPTSRSLVSDKLIICESPRKKIIADLLQTEREYTRTISDFIRVYIEPFSQVADGAKVKNVMKRKASTSRTVHARRKSSMLKGLTKIGGASNKSKHVAEFLNGSTMLQYMQTLRQIGIVNNNFCETLAKCVVDGGGEWCVGPCLVDFTALLNIYLQYHRSFSDICSCILTDEASSSIISKDARKGMRQLIDALDARSEGSVTFAKLVSKPVERSAQYRGIIEALNKATGVEHPDKETIQEALGNLASFASQRLNDAFEKSSTAKLHSLYESISGLPTKFEYSHHRELLKSGPLIKRCRRNDKEYTFFLFSDVLVYASKKSQGPGSLKSEKRYVFHRMLPLTTLRITDLPSGTTSRADGVGDPRRAFEIASPGKSFVVLMPRGDVGAHVSKEAWLRAIGDASQACREAKATASSAPSSAAPVWQSDEASSHCSLCPQRFTMIVRKHHCRKCGILVCGDCSRNKRLLPSQHATKLLRICDDCASEAIYTPS